MLNVRVAELQPFCTVPKSRSSGAMVRQAWAMVAVSDTSVQSLLNALLLSPAGRLPAAQACIALGVAPVTLRGAVPHVQRLLNVEGYGVLTVDVDGTTLVLDRELLRDQFELVT